MFKRTFQQGRSEREPEEVHTALRVGRSLFDGSSRTERPLLRFRPSLPFTQLHRKGLPGKYAVKVSMAVRGGGNEFDGFVHTDRRAAAS